jgi:hypothetical protein
MKMNTMKNRSAIALSMLGAVAGLAVSEASANSVRYKIGPLPMVVVNDNGPGDIDPAVNRIRVSINAGVNLGGGNTYSVNAIITATSLPLGNAKPSLDFTMLRITNQSGNINAQTMWVEHDFPQLIPPNSTFKANFAGRFDSLTNPGNLGGAFLTYTGRVKGTDSMWTTVASGATPWGSGAAPIPFLFSGIAVKNWASVERTDLFFYLDSPGDSILVNAVDGSRLYAAGILPLGALALVRRGRRSSATV